MNINRREWIKKGTALAAIPIVGLAGRGVSHTWSDNRKVWEVAKPLSPIAQELEKLF